MSKPTKTLEFKFERTIPASPGEIFDGWLDPAIPGNPWNAADKFVLDPKVDGLFYWAKGASHYGRFTEMQRPHRIQHTWVSANTMGEESTVTLTFENKGGQTLMTLVHSGIPDSEGGKTHEKGWNYFLNIFPEQFRDASEKKA